MRFLHTFLLVMITTFVMGCEGGSGAGKSSVSSSAPQVLSVEMDRKINALMRESGATAVTVAVAKNGKIEYEQAYGHLDAGRSNALTADALMRSASIVKPITAAAVRKLEESGILALSDHVFCNGSNAPCWLSENLLSATSDTRAKDITLMHLIAHEGGWYSDVSGDPLEQEIEIRDFLALSGPPTREDIIRYVMKAPLNYTPGAPDFIHHNYSNFGYLLLGMVIEQASQTHYIDYAYSEIMDPLGISIADFKIGGSRRVDHDPREPNYISTDICPSVFAVDQLALCAEEGADNNNWFAALGVITTARAMALFSQHYRLPKNYSAGYGITGQPLSSSMGYGSHGGSLPGLSSMVRQLPSGVSYAIFLNVSFNLEPSLNSIDWISELPSE